jgi:GT2 family glycosyltransferase
MPVRLRSVPNSQQGVARNAGVREAKAPTCLFIQDDIFLEPDACEEHQLAHAALQFEGETNVAVLGFTTWDADMEITPVMRWLEDTGWQFGYPRLQPEDFVPRVIQHQFTYTSHISLPTAVARRHPFREDVTLYGWEDIEWGMRLRDDNVHLFYLPAAKAAHHHQLSLDQSLKRMETLGQSAVIMEQAVPGFDRVPRGWKRYAYDVLALLPTMRGKHVKAFLRGIEAQ